MSILPSAVRPSPRSDAARFVVLLGIGDAAIVLWRHRDWGADTTYSSLWAIALLTIVLQAFAEAIPQVAVPFAILVFLSLAIYHPTRVGARIAERHRKKGGVTP
jgi:hypothetical protein